MVFLEIKSFKASSSTQIYFLLFGIGICFPLNAPFLSWYSSPLTLLKYNLRIIIHTFLVICGTHTAMNPLPQLRLKK